MNTSLITWTLAATLFAGLALQPAFGGDASEDRFHEAYVLEVVDGKVADAAKAYLSLTVDETASARIRNEARFRFAVCSVLLGRVDEARLRLGALLRDANAAADLKARTQEYLEALTDVGMGTELERKMRELVFELGRENANATTPKQYRDFEVIGEGARPFLRELLQHTDKSLRTHAFRLLIRMNEPGMFQSLPHEVVLGGYWIADDAAAYMKRNEGAREDLEAALLALDESALREVLRDTGGRFGFSVDFLREAARRGLQPEEASAHVLAGGWTPQTRTLITEWVRGDDAPLAFELSKRLAAACIAPEFVGKLDPELLVDVSRQLASSHTWVLRSRPGGQFVQVRPGLKKWQEHVPPAVALRVLESVLTHRSEWGPHVTLETVQQTQADSLMQRAWSGVPEDVQPQRVVAVLRLWIKLRRDTISNPPVSPQGEPRPIMGEAPVAWVRRAASRLNAQDSAAFTEFLLEEPAWTSPGSIVASLPYGSAEQQARLTKALLALKPQEQISALETWSRTHRANNETGWPTGLAAVLLDGLSDLLRTQGPEAHHLSLLAADLILPSALCSLDATDARSHLVRVMGELGSFPKTTNAHIFASLFPYWRNEAEVRYGTDVLIPSLEQIYRAAPSRKDRRMLLEATRQMFKYVDAGVMNLGAAEPTAVRFVLDHLDESAAYFGDIFLIQRERFPLASFAARVPADEWGKFSFQPDPNHAEVLAYCRQQMSDPATRTASAYQFAVRALSREERNEVFVPLLESGTAQEVERVLNLTNQFPLDVLERVVARFDDDAELPDESLAIAAKVVLSARPSVRLFPTVKRLLQSETRVLTGIEMAESLGQRELVPDLVRLLDSMDGGRRKAARAAIDSILELDRLRSEAKLSEAPSPPAKDK